MTYYHLLDRWDQDQRRNGASRSFSYTKKIGIVRTASPETPKMLSLRDKRVQAIIVKIDNLKAYPADNCEFDYAYAQLETLTLALNRRLITEDEVRGPEKWEKVLAARLQHAIQLKIIRNMTELDAYRCRVNDISPEWISDEQCALIRLCSAPEIA